MDLVIANLLLEEIPKRSIDRRQKLSLILVSSEMFARSRFRSRTGSTLPLWFQEIGIQSEAYNVTMQQA